MDRLIKRIGAIFIIATMLMTPVAAYAEEQNAATDMQFHSGDEASTAESVEAEEQITEETEESSKIGETEETEDAVENEKDDSEEEEKPGLSTVEEARKGVLQVNCIYTDDLGNAHIVQGGSGFLIGSSEGTEYALTNYHIIHPDRDYRRAAFKAIGVSKDEEWDKIELKAQVVVTSDVVLDATVVKASEALDLVVLKLEQPLYTSTPLTILTADSKNSDKPYNIPEKALALGYPTGITYDNAVYYSPEQVSMTSGSIANATTLNGVAVIQHDAKVDESSCGGPLVNEHGLVIGMNELLSDGSNYYSLDSTEIVSVLDGLGIEYSKMTATEYDELLNPPEPVAEPEPVPVPEPEPVPNPINKRLVVAIIIAGVLLLALVATVIVLLIVGSNKNKKENKKKNTKKEQAQAPTIDRFGMPVNQPGATAAPQNPRAQIQSNVGSFAKGNETTTLGMTSQSEGTTVLGGAAAVSNANFLGTLIRKKNGENIVINKDNFAIGKDSLNIDFRIADNSAVSRRHATIKQIGAEIIIEDNFSTNGTFVNGARLAEGQSSPIKSGDVIMLANEEFDYRI